MATDLVKSSDREEMAVLERVLIMGDLADLSSPERVQYYNALCHSLKLNPLSRPFEYVEFDKRLQLYARKDCADQLRRIHGVSIVALVTEVLDDVCITTATARIPEGRTDIDQGVVNIRGLSGQYAANGRMKSVTKAKRRVTLSLCGLGIVDESELETIAGARIVRVDEATGEILEPPAALTAGTPQSPATLIQPAPAAKPPPWPGSREEFALWKDLARRARDADVAITPPIEDTPREEVAGIIAVARATVEAGEEQIAREKATAAA